MTASIAIRRRWSGRSPIGRASFVPRPIPCISGAERPSLLGGARLARLIETAARLFSLDGAEITLEANPADAEPGGASPLRDTLRDFAAAGGNRLSLGMQSASGEELRLLGRRHGPEAVLHTVEAAERRGLTTSPSI